MGIKGLTDRQASFPQIGTLRKGAPKPEQGNRPGADLQYFRFDTDDARAAEMFRAAYGDEPTEINIYFAYQTPEENFQAWQEEYSKSSLKHRCDGETMVLWLDERTGKYSQVPKPCAGGCKPTGRLFVIVPELQRFAYVVVGTTSVHDIIRITENLEALYAMRGDLRGIPFVLRRTPEMISTPASDGGRARREKWLLSVEALPEWVALQLQATKQTALGKPSPRMLTVNANTGEIVDTDDVVIESLDGVDELSIDPNADYDPDADFDSIPGQGASVSGAYAKLIDKLTGPSLKFAEWARKNHRDSDGPATQPQYRYLGAVINAITGEDGSHHALLEILTGRPTNSDNPPGYDLASKLLDWLPEEKTEKDEGGKKRKVANPDYQKKYVDALLVIWRVIQESNGQQSLPLE